MKLQRVFYNLLILAFVATLAFSSWQPAFAQSPQPFAASGLFSVVWGDASSGAGVARYFLASDTGEMTELFLNEALTAPLGGILSVDRKRVTISGHRSLAESGAATAQVDAIAFENPQEAGDVSANAVTGSQPFISIMCKFNDVSAEPKTLSYFQNMYSNVYPGLDDYWQEASYTMANVTGSSAAGWYTLPHPRSYYVYDSNPSDPGDELDLALAAQDCTGVADPSVDFSPYLGINLMFNDELDGYAWGGFGHYLVLDGAGKSWPMTWEPPWGYSDITIISHEMGHAFGLPHSSGPYTNTYDNPWDVMSDSSQNCYPLYNGSPYGCLAQHTISYHKDRLGWIPAPQKYTASWNTNATLTLEQLSIPQTSNYLMVQIPINGSTTRFYTVEARRQVGYDVKLFSNAVVIHDVDTSRWQNTAHVVDTNADGNNDPGDAGSAWLPGERFSDAINGIYIKVLSATASGFVVSIQTPSILKSVAANDGWVLESGENTTVGGTLNAGATTFRVGDDAANKQYRSILSFDTSGLPDNAVITKVKLKILKQGLVGTDPFTTHGPLRVDIRKLFFGAAGGLEAGDFQAAASAGSVGTFGSVPSGAWYISTLSATANSFVNRTGISQFRLRFNLDDNNDKGADFVSFYSGNDATAANRPQLIVQYYVP